MSGIVNDGSKLAGSAKRRAYLRAATFGGIGFAILTALLWLYAPLRETLPPAIDFAEWGPLLAERDGPIAGYLSIVDRYAEFGRYNPVSFAFISLSWQLFGWDASGWAVLRFIAMLVSFVLMTVLFRRLTGSTVAGLAGSSVLLAGPSVSEVWVFVHIGEGYALPFVLLASLAAVGAGPRNRTAASLMCGLALAAAVLCKETLIATVPFVIALVLMFDERGWHRPRFDASRRRFLSIVAAVVLSVAVLPILVVASSATASEYVSQYSLASITWTNSRLVVRNILLQGRELTDPISVSLIGLLVMGWGLTLRRRSRSSAQYSFLVWAALVLLASGVIVYLPWPAERHWMLYYAAPYMLGIGLLLSGATSIILAAGSRITKVLFSLGVLLLIALNFRFGHRATRHYFAEQDLGRTVAIWIATKTTTDTVFLASQRPTGQTTLKFDAFRLVSRLAQTRVLQELSCDALSTRRISNLHRGAVVFYETDCLKAVSRLQPPTDTLVVHSGYVSIARRRLVTDTLRVFAWTPRTDDE